MVKSKIANTKQKTKGGIELLLKELDCVKHEIEEETKHVETLDSKLKNINDTIFMGHHDFKMLKLELKNKEIELRENKAFSLMSIRTVENAVNRCVLKCYENFLSNVTNDTVYMLRFSDTLELQKEKQLSHMDYEKLISITNVEHLTNLKHVVFSQNQIIDEMNKRFIDRLKEIRKQYFKMINLERENLDKQRQNHILNLKKEKNEDIKTILADYDEKVQNIQKYFEQILNDQMEMIQELEVTSENEMKRNE